MPVLRNIVKDMNIQISCPEKQNKTINSLQFKDLMIYNYSQYLAWVLSIIWESRN